ncbi:MAG TPA: glycosyltransferase family 1 protein [Desulfobacterales bacterium]|nr:glycosyltransferase family 1 protein [Desulfobacterales bacterium]
MKIIITLRESGHLGGVVSFYKSIVPYLNNDKNKSFIFFHIGKKINRKIPFHVIMDQFRFQKKLRQLNPDIVHVNPSLNLKSFLRDGLFIYWAKRKNLPVLVFWHGWGKKFEKKIDTNLFFYWFFKKTFLRADKTIVLASDFKKKLISWGVKSDIILGTTVIDESLLEGFDINKKIQKINKSKKINILFLSRIEKEKGIFETISAFKMLLDKNYNIKLNIVGDGTALESVKRYSKAIKIPENKLSFLGYVKGYKKKEVFINNHIYCFPTYCEGMPISVLEAMSFGMPVITRAVGGLKDFFQDKQMGFSTTSKNPYVFAKLVEKLIINKSLISDIGLYNHRFAEKHFAASIGFKLLESLYYEICNTVEFNKMIH